MTAVILPPSVPSIRRGFRLQFEPAQGCHVLLYPEGMIKLNDSASEILQQVDGKRSVAEIIGNLQQRFLMCRVSTKTFLPSWRWPMLSSGSSFAKAGHEPGPPLWLLAELTYRCPLQCPYCSNPLDFSQQGRRVVDRRMDRGIPPGP